MQLGANTLMSGEVSGAGPARKQESAEFSGAAGAAQRAADEEDGRLGSEAEAEARVDEQAVGPFRVLSLIFLQADR